MAKKVDLAGRVAVVTGSGNGIGRASALSLAESGAAVVISDVVVEDAERTAAEISNAGGTAIALKADISVESDVKAIYDAAFSRFKKVDILVNNAGVGGSFARIHEMEVEEWDRVNNVNLRGTYMMTKYAITDFLKHGGGAIINIASTYGLIGAPKAPAYCATKGGIINLTRQLAVDYGKDGIRVNAICPGYIDTSLRRRKDVMGEAEWSAAMARREKAAAMQPLGRQAEPSEVGEVVAFLASDNASFMTGSIVTVDGGCVTTFNYGEASN